MLPAGAFLNKGFGPMPGGNCTPTCVASPVRSVPVQGALSLPTAAFVDTDPSSPSRPRAGSLASVVSTSPQACGIVGDASTRTPTAGATSSSYKCGGAAAGSDASARTPGARLLLAPTVGPWSVLVSPSAPGGL